MRAFKTSYLLSAANVSLVILMASSAHAALVISTDATQNVTCSGGICSATAVDAVLNVGDVTTMLAATPLTIQSGNQAQNILIEAPFSWTSSNALTLDSYDAITVDKPVSDAGPAALNIRYNDGGTSGMLLFRTKGRIHFTGTKNSLSINSQNFTLVNSIASLASAVTRKPHGFYALAKNYDATGDGTYNGSPIPVFKREFFEGLGNSISNLTIDGGASACGFFCLLGTESIVADISFINANLTTATGQAGILAGQAQGATVRNVHISGSILDSARFSSVGGLIGAGFSSRRHYTIVTNSYSAAVIQFTGYAGQAGGLVGTSYGAILTQSFATGMVHGSTNSYVGGLIGQNSGTTENCYAIGAATTGDWDGQSNTHASVGGLAGFNGFPTQFSYSTGMPSGGSDSYVGGFIGEASDYDGDIKFDYWDTTNSQTKKATGKGDPSGIEGLTTKQLKSALPEGFDPAVWAEDPKINHGYPYLIANPPPK